MEKSDRGGFLLNLCGRVCDWKMGLGEEKQSKSKSKKERHESIPVSLFFPAVRPKIKVKMGGKM